MVFIFHSKQHEYSINFIPLLTEFTKRVFFKLWNRFPVSFFYSSWFPDEWKVLFKIPLSWMFHRLSWSKISFFSEWIPSLCALYSLFFLRIFALLLKSTEIGQTHTIRNVAEKMLFLIHQMHWYIFVSFSLMNCILNCLTEQLKNFKVAKNTQHRIIDPKLIELFFSSNNENFIFPLLVQITALKQTSLSCVFGTMVKHGLNRNEQLKLHWRRMCEWKSSVETNDAENEKF